MALRSHGIGSANSALVRHRTGTRSLASVFGVFSQCFSSSLSFFIRKMGNILPLCYEERMKESG